MKGSGINKQAKWKKTRRQRRKGRVEGWQENHQINLTRSLGSWARQLPIYSIYSTIWNLIWTAVQQRPCVFRDAHEHVVRCFTSRKAFRSWRCKTGFSAVKNRNSSEMTSRIIFLGVNRLCVLVILKIEDIWGGVTTGTIKSSYQIHLTATSTHKVAKAVTSFWHTN